MKTAEDIQKHFDSVGQSLRIAKVNEAAKNILQGWIAATPGATPAFVKANVDAALAAAEELVAATEAMPTAPAPAPAPEEPPA